MTPHLVLAALAAASLGGLAAPAHADLCVTVNVGPQPGGCLPWGSPLPDLGCPLNPPSLVVVCT